MAFCFALQAVHFFNAFGITWRHPSHFFSYWSQRWEWGEKRRIYKNVFSCSTSIWFILLVKTLHKNNHSLLLWLLLCMGEEVRGKGTSHRNLICRKRKSILENLRTICGSPSYPIASGTNYHPVYLSSMSRKKSWWTTFLQEMYQGNPGLDYLINQWS